MVETRQGHQLWEFDGQRYTQVGMNAVAGRRPEDVTLEPTRFEDMRRGCLDIDARIADMDINGVWASLNFPSQITGFSGRVFSQASDPELGLAVTRAFNDWVYEAWWGPYPERIIPCGITYLTDPELGAAEIRRNAERGFRSVTLPERPHRIGLPSIFSGYWDPIVAACAETQTVISLHVGSSGMPDMPDGRPPGPAGRHPLRPDVADLVRRVDLVGAARPLPRRADRHERGRASAGWPCSSTGWRTSSTAPATDGTIDATGLRPAEVLARNFWFCTIDDPSTIETRHVIGVDHVMVEVDYPHGDSTWPDTQAVIEGAWGHLPVEDLRKLTHENAARLYRWPLPPDRHP